MSKRTLYQVIKKYNPKTNYNKKIRNQDCKILSLLEQDEKFTVADVANKSIKRTMKTTNQNTIEDNITRALRVGKSLGIIQKLQVEPITLAEFKQLETIKALQDSLKKSKIIHFKREGGTFKSYSNALWHFNNWLCDQKMNLIKETPLPTGGYDKKTEEIAIEGLEHFLELYRDSPSHKESTKFVRMCLQYLNLKQHDDLSPATMNIKHSAIKSYFKYNLAPIEIPFSPYSKHDDILSENKQDFIISLDELFEMLTIGKSSILEKAVVLCKFHRGLDNITFADRFNYEVWDQLVKAFGTENYLDWDLSKCPVESVIPRVKTSYLHRGFLDRDAVEAIQNYLEQQNDFYFIFLS